MKKKITSALIVLATAVLSYTVTALIFALPVQLLWNHVILHLTVVRPVNFWQAFALITLGQYLTLHPRPLEQVTFEKRTSAGIALITALIFKPNEDGKDIHRTVPGTSATKGTDQKGAEKSPTLD